MEAYSFLLLLTVVVEILASNWKLWTGLGRNDIVYNIFFLVSFPVQFYIFYRMLNLEAIAKVIFKVFSALVLILAFINCFLFQGLFEFNNYSFVLNQLINIFFSVMILFKLAVRDDIDVNFLKEPYFWICGGTLLFSLGALVVIGLREFTILYDLQINGTRVYRYLMPVLCVVLYSCYSYGFFLCKKQTMK
ncbi:MAG: hypothetical protein ABIP95_03820 [Pelobium sp.]